MPWNPVSGLVETKMKKRGYMYASWIALGQLANIGCGFGLQSAPDEHYEPIKDIVSQ